MSIASKTQTAKPVFDATTGNLTGITEIKTDAGVMAGAIAVVTNPFTGGGTVVTGLGNLVGDTLKIVGGAIALKKVGEMVNFDPFFGMLG